MKANIDAVNENAEMKRLLKLIYDEMREEYRCCYCVYEELNARHTPCSSCDLSIKLNFKWKHADEVEKLLKKEINKE